MGLNFIEDDTNNQSTADLFDDSAEPEKTSNKNVIDEYLAIDDEENQQSLDTEDIDEEDDDEEDIEPTKAITKHDFASSPWSMLGGVGGVFFLVFGSGYLFLNSIFNGSSAVVVKKEQTEPEQKDKAVDKTDGDVYAKLALKQQQDELAKLNQEEDIENKEDVTKVVEKKEENNQKPKSKTIPKTIPKATPVAFRTPPPRVARSYVPPPRPRTIPSPKRPTVTIPRRVHKVAKPISRQVISRTPQVAKDPIAELNRLRSIGSFGNIDYSQLKTKPRNTGETLVASTVPMYETPRQRRLRRRQQLQNQQLPTQELQTQELKTATISNRVTRTPTSTASPQTIHLQTIRPTNTIEKITPKWEPNFNNQVEVATPTIPKNQPTLVHYTSSSITTTPTIPPQQTQITKKPKTDFIEAIKQAKVRTIQRNNYYSLQVISKNRYLPQEEKILQTQPTQIIQKPKIDFIEAIKQAKARTIQRNNYHSLQLASNDRYLAQEERILQSNKPRYLIIGEHASGRLLTPITKQQSNTGGQNKRFVAKLTQDMRDNSGAIAIPKETLLAVKITSVDGASTAEVEVTAIIKNETEYPIPPGTISVYGKNGTPLIAKQFKDKGGEIARYDATIGLMGGLNKVGQIINQPEDEETIEDPLTGRIRNVRRNTRRNIGGAILEGAFGELTGIVKKRAETSTQEIIARPNVWFIPARTQLTFIVNRSIQLPNQM